MDPFKSSLVSGLMFRHDMYTRHSFKRMVSDTFPHIFSFCWNCAVLSRTVLSCPVPWQASWICHHHSNGPGGLACLCLAVQASDGASVLAGFGFEGYDKEGKVIGWNGVSLGGEGRGRGTGREAVSG